MFELKKKPTFLNILKILQEADSFAGIYILKEPSETKIYKHLFQKLTRIRFRFLYYLLIFGTLITTKFKLISIIFCSSLISMCYTLEIAVESYVKNKKILKGLLEWCEGLYDIKKKFHPFIHDLAENHFVTIEKRTKRVVKWFRIALYSDFTMIFFIFLMIGIFLPDKILPKYCPPAPLYLPFEKQETWTAFSVTTFIQTLLYFDTTSFVVYIFITYLTIIFHFLGYLELIIAYTRQTGEDMKTLSSKEIIFEDSMKIITEMISDVNKNISVCSKFYAITFLFTELCCFASLFICGLIITIVHEQYAFAIGTTSTTVMLWIICYMNEKILDKFDEIKETLYDIPWYDLEPKQRKILLIVMNCDEIQKGFTAAGFHDLTMERFGIVMKSGYANMVVLKDLVLKS